MNLCFLNNTEKIFKAIDLGRRQVVKTILDEGFDINTIGGRYNMTPLILAAWRGNRSLVRLLIQRGADVNAKVTSVQNQGSTPLDAAIETDPPEIADLLRKPGGRTGEELKAEGK